MKAKVEGKSTPSVKAPKSTAAPPPWAVDDINGEGESARFSAPGLPPPGLDEHRFDSPEPPKVDRRKIRRVLENAGFKVLSADPLPKGIGVKFVLECGAVIPVYNTKRYLVQGKVHGKEKLELDTLLWDLLSPPVRASKRTSLEAR